MKWGILQYCFLRPAWVIIFGSISKKCWGFIRSTSVVSDLVDQIYYFISCTRPGCGDFGFLWTLLRGQSESGLGSSLCEWTSIQSEHLATFISGSCHSIFIRDGRFYPGLWCKRILKMHLLQVAMYCLIQFYVSVSALLKPNQPLLKLFSVKAVG
jgi:Organic solute transporter Ostalpha